MISSISVEWWWKNKTFLVVARLSIFSWSKINTSIAGYSLLFAWFVCRNHIIFLFKYVRNTIRICTYRYMEAHNFILTKKVHNIIWNRVFVIETWLVILLYMEGFPELLKIKHNRSWSVCSTPLCHVAVPKFFSNACIPLPLIY
jgi:hypothetical protein